MRHHDRARFATLLGGGLLAAAPALAHPGHGLGGGSASWLHYATDPLHVAPLAAAVAALVLWRRARSRARTR
jgi:hypothetical protein